MSTMTRPSIWAQATTLQREKAAKRALRRKKPLKTRSASDLQWYLSHGWRIMSHTQPSYGQGQYWLLVPEHL